MKTRLSAAFSLIEILVVITIIAILATLLVPSVGKAMEKAAMAADMNNPRQVGQGIAAFAGENGGKIPNSKIPLNGNTNSSFMESVDRMLAPDKIFLSGVGGGPQSAYNWIRRPVWYSKSYAKMPAGMSYAPPAYYWGQAWGMNVYLWYNASPLNNANSFDGNISRAPNLSKLVIVGEQNGGGHEFNPRVAPDTNNNVKTYYRVSRNGKAYYLFGDYHIELIEGDQSVIAHPEYKTYNPTNRLYYAW